MAKFKWCSCQHRCNGGVQVHERTYLWHRKHHDADSISRCCAFSERYSTLGDVNPRIKQAVARNKVRILNPTDPIYANLQYETVRRSRHETRAPAGRAMYESNGKHHSIPGLAGGGSGDENTLRDYGQHPPMSPQHNGQTNMNTTPPVSPTHYRELSYPCD